MTVIGAGLAGLAAALNLHRAGWRVTVLEARGRVGGRVFTVRDGFAEGQYAEGGGEFIDDHHGRMLALAREFGLALDPVGAGWSAAADLTPDDEWAALNGRVGPERDAPIWGCDLAAEVRRVWEALAALGAGVSDPARPSQAPGAAALDAQSAADWLRSLDVHPFARLSFESQIRAEYTVEASQFSLLDLARNASLYYRDPGRQWTTYRIQGGNDLLPRAMAAALPPSTVRLNAPAIRVGATADAVSVSYRAGMGEASISSGYAILAIPLTTARLLQFDPPLPPAHQAMVQGVSYGSVTKVLIQYQRRWWREKRWNGHLMNDDPLACTWEPTGEQAGERGLLTVYTGGEPGAAFARLSDAERIIAAVAALDRLFPGTRSLVEHAETIAWPNEPYTRGAYMALAPGEVGRFWDTLFAPAGRLYFAGEHAAVCQGYMEGAVESGQRVARELLALGD